MTRLSIEDRMMNRLSRLLIALACVVGVACWAVPASAQTLVTNTTLTAEVTSGTQGVITLASTSGVAVGWWVFIDREVMVVNTVISSTQLAVRRGANGNTSLHSSNVNNGVSQANVVFLGPPNYFKTVDPAPGPCTRVNVDYIPWINVQSGNVWSCIASTWRGTNVVPFAFNSTQLVQYLQPLDDQPRFRVAGTWAALVRDWVRW